MEEQAMLTPHRPRSTCRMWDCHRFAATYCSMDHSVRSTAYESFDRAAIYVDDVKEEVERDLTDKIFQSLLEGHACGIPTLPAEVLQQNPWNFPQRFPMERLANENIRNFIFLSDSGVAPANIWSRYDIRNIIGYVRCSWNLRPQPDLGRYRVRRYTSPHYAARSLFWLRFDWNKLNKKRKVVTTSVPNTHQDKTKEDHDCAEGEFAYEKTQNCDIEQHALADGQVKNIGVGLKEHGIVEQLVRIVSTASPEKRRQQCA